MADQDRGNICRPPHVYLNTHLKGKVKPMNGDDQWDLLNGDPGDDGWQDPSQVPPGFDPEDQIKTVGPAEFGAPEDGHTTGYLDGFGQFEVVDLDGDGVADRLGIDGDGDGIVDFSIDRSGDLFVISGDSDHDGVPDWQESFTAAELQAQHPELWGIISDTAGLLGDPGRYRSDDSVARPDTGSYTIADGVMYGDPFALGDEWFSQAWNGSCLPASVAQIYMEYTGQSVTDLDFVNLANQVFQEHGGGWIVGEDGVPGLPPAAAADLLQEAGIPATYEEGLTLDDLRAAVEQGPVMVAVDSGEYWTGEPVEDNQMDHAVDVTAVGPLIDASGNLVLDEYGQTIEVVYLSDTGIETGNRLPVPVDVFMDAWKDSGFAAVVCEVSADDFRASHAGGVERPGGVPLDSGPVDSVKDAASWLAAHPSWWVVPVRLVVPAVAAAGVAAFALRKRR